MKTLIVTIVITGKNNQKGVVAMRLGHMAERTKPATTAI
jgi:hypothetical protein